MNTGNCAVNIINCKPAHLETGLDLAQILSFPAKTGASVKLGFYSSVNATRPSRFIDWNDLLKLAENPSIGPKDDAQLITPHDGTGKKKEDAQSSSFHAVIVDYDDGTKTFDEVCSHWQGQGLKALLFTTTHHMQPHPRNGRIGPRFKAVLPLSEPLDSEQWHELARGLSVLQGGDTSQSQVHQGFYAPNRLHDDAEYHYVELPGEFFSLSSAVWQQAVAAYKKRQEEQAIEARATPKPRQLKNANDASIIGLINDAYTLEMLLSEHGYKRRGKKYLSPFSESGIAGVSILERDGKEVIFSHHSQNDPLSALNHDGHSLDVADTLCCLQYSGDFSRMIRTEAEALDPVGNKQRQREHMQQQAADEAKREVDAMGGGDNFDLAQFSLTGQSHQMRQQMLDDKFILGKLALLGQWTLFFAKSGSGKTLITLHLLIEAVKSGNLKGKDIIYINADDNHRGVVQKLELIEPYGIEMIVPGYNGFDDKLILAMLRRMGQCGTSQGKVIILDTIKKFVDVMDKRRSTEFGKAIREFILHGGSVIALAHVNKHRDGEGKVIFAGTSDSVDDADCAYLLDMVNEQPNGLRTVMFENFKSRGDVARKVSYQYDASGGTGYADLLSSVEIISKDDLKAVEKQAERQAIIEKNAEIIPIIRALIEEGVNSKTELVKEAQDRSGESLKTIRRALKEHDGDNYLNGEYWHTEKGDRGLTTYYITKLF